MKYTTAAVIEQVSVLLHIFLKPHKLFCKLFCGKIIVHNTDKIDKYKYHQHTDNHTYNNLGFFRVNYGTYYTGDHYFRLYNRKLYNFTQNYLLI